MHFLSKLKKKILPIKENFALFVYIACFREGYYSQATVIVTHISYVLAAANNHQVYNHQVKVRQH
jgi:hypothetical protein